MKFDLNPKFYHKVKKIVTWSGIVFVSFLLLIFAFVFSVKLGFFGRLPNDKELRKIKQNNASVLMSSDGKMLGLYYYTNRTNAKIEEIPQSFIDALVATEDVRFYQHNGFDTRSFFRVLFKTILLFDRSSGGGSTITQQLAKNLFPRENLSLLSLPVAKIKEIFTAMRLEDIYTKSEILELYLNTVPFGENTYGIETAALTYFGKKPSELNLQESALMVGLLKANTHYNPRINREAALNRRNTVFNQMVKYDYLNPAAADSLKALPVELHFTRLTSDQGIAPYFREMVRRDVEDIIEDYNLKHDTTYNIYADGLTIYATLNARLQVHAEQSVATKLSSLQKDFRKQWNGRYPWVKNPSLADLQIRQSKPYRKLIDRGVSPEDAIDSMSVPHKTRVFTWEGEKDTVMSSLDSVLYHFGVLQCGLLSIEGQSGKVLAWVGGPNFKYFKYDHVKARRQVGSTIKPLIYAAAIENGLHPCTYIENDSIAYEEAEDWVPRNADRKYGGFYSVQGALVNSVNTVSVKVLMKTGINRTLVSLYEAGLPRPLPQVPSLALGTAEIPLYDMVPAYATFINDGRNPGIYYIDSIVDANGDVLFRHPEAEPNPQVFSTATQEIMKALLLGVSERGTAARLNWEYHISDNTGGKTGTTQNYADGWFMGVTPNTVTGVWVGGENPAVRFRNMSQGQGSKTALPIFAGMIKSARADDATHALVSGDFNIPDAVYEELDCPDFKKHRGLKDILPKKWMYNGLDLSSPDTSGKVKVAPGEDQDEKKQTKIGRFLRKIFGGKDKNK